MNKVVKPRCPKKPKKTVKSTFKYTALSADKVSLKNVFKFVKNNVDETMTHAMFINNTIITKDDNGYNSYNRYSSRNYKITISYNNKNYDDELVEYEKKKVIYDAKLKVYNKYLEKKKIADIEAIF